MEILLGLMGGLGLFLFGMKLMSDGLEKAAGAKMRSILEFFTKNTIRGILVGTFFTAVIQSSSAATVMTVSFVNSGLMNLYQAAGVIMGANIGTTVTGQLIRMADISGDSLLLTLIQPKTFAPVVAFVGCIFYVFLRNAKNSGIWSSIHGDDHHVQLHVYIENRSSSLRDHEFSDESLSGDFSGNCSDSSFTEFICDCRNCAAVS